LEKILLKPVDVARVASLLTINDLTKKGTMLYILYNDEILVARHLPSTRYLSIFVLV